MGQMERLTGLLREGNYSCVIANGGVVRTFTQRGVADLYRLLREEPAFLRGALVADKVVGKAAAALMALGGVRRLHAGVMSRPARDLLERAGVEASYGCLVPYVMNRDQSGWCPLETLCCAKESLDEIYETIDGFVNRKETILTKGKEKEDDGK